MVGDKPSNCSGKAMEFITLRCLENERQYNGSTYLYVICKEMESRVFYNLLNCEQCEQYYHHLVEALYIRLKKIVKIPLYNVIDNKIHVF